MKYRLLASLLMATAMVPASVAAGGMSGSNSSSGSFFGNTVDDPWRVRVRALAVAPAESADVSTIGGDVSISTTFVPEVDISYFFTEHIAAELIAAVTPHTVSSKGSSLGSTTNLGDVWLLPPTITLQYHFQPEEKFKPYLGAGINYTMFFGENEGDAIINDIEYDDSFGLAFQAGFDYAIGKDWGMNVDVKHILINTDVSINNGAINADVDIDPWIVGIGAYFKF